MRALHLAQELAETYRAALERIARSESGVWGRIAHEALTDGLERMRCA